MKPAADTITCVLGDNHVNTLGIIRSFGELGYRPFIVIPENGKLWVTKCRYISQTFIVKRDYEDLLEALNDSYTEGYNEE